MLKKKCVNHSDIVCYIVAMSPLMLYNVHNKRDKALINNKIGRRKNEHERIEIRVGGRNAG